MAHIKSHYYASHATINPTRVIPMGPEVDYAAPHDRAALGLYDRQHSDIAARKGALA